MGKHEAPDWAKDLFVFVALSFGLVFINSSITLIKTSYNSYIDYMSIRARLGGLVFSHLQAVHKRI
jgi:hypothetical protein